MLAQVEEYERETYIWKFGRLPEETFRTYEINIFPFISFAQCYAIVAESTKITLGAKDEVSPILAPTTPLRYIQ
jgi:hypothetical protein